MLAAGDQVHHESQKDSFGAGTIISINEAAGTALVEWKTHEVSRKTEKLKTQHSHVNISNLVKI